MEFVMFLGRGIVLYRIVIAKYCLPTVAELWLDKSTRKRQRRGRS